MAFHLNPISVYFFLLLALHYHTVHCLNSGSLVRHRSSLQPGRRCCSTDIRRSAIPLFQSAASSTDRGTEYIQASPVFKLKRDILALAAAYDRGFGATPYVRDKMDRLISDLSDYLEVEDVAIGFGGSSSGNDTDSMSHQSPLNGTWQLIYTNAFDVLSLATPLNTVSAVYQELNPSKQTAVNIIDLIPRIPTTFFSSMPNFLTRLKVKTKAYRRGPKRVGLNFESVEVQPLKDLLQLPFTPIKFDLPTKYLTELLSSSYDSPGFFDVRYVDDDMLIIQQNAPGGYFVSVKVSSAHDP
jgi:hypothetical protein